MGLLVVGDVVTDVVARHAAPPAADVAAGVDVGAEIALRGGGSGANTACWAAHLGADARLLARAGADSGEWHIAALRHAGVRPHVRIDPHHPTAVVIALVDGSGERSMLTDRGAGGRLGPADWDDALLEGVRHVHLSGYTLFTESGLHLARLALRAAARRAIPVSVDPASTAFLRDFGHERFIAETAGAGIVFPNRDEALALTGESGAHAAAARLSRRYGLAVVKLGGSGALAARGGRVVAQVPAVPAAVVDSTGAGDAFAAGFLAASLAGGDDRACLEAGCRAGAAAVGRMGGRPEDSRKRPSTLLAS